MRPERHPAWRSRWYILHAVEQAVRLTREQRDEVTLGIVQGEVRDRFLLADAAAVDEWIVCQTPDSLPHCARLAAKPRSAERGGARNRHGRGDELEAYVSQFSLQRIRWSRLRGPCPCARTTVSAALESGQAPSLRVNVPSVQAYTHVAPAPSYWGPPGPPA